MREAGPKASAAALGACLLTACAPHLRPSDAVVAPGERTEADWGRYVAVAADCAACHADPGGSGALSGGRPIPTPFGTVLASNITPDRATGIGAWSDAQFDTAVRLGRAPGGKWLYPAMPYPYYSHMKAADVLALRAYLRTLAPVRHEVQENQLPFPFDIRAGMRLWDAMYFTPGTLQADPRKSADWNRGAYLVEGPGHCPACHTPKSRFGGDSRQEPLEGYALRGWFAPDIAGGAQRGLGDWSADDVVAYLQTGHNRFAGATGPMAEEVAWSTSRLSADDLRSIAVFLKDEPDRAVAARAVDAHDPAMVTGSAVYGDLCSACHAPDGTGVPFLIPDLAHSSSVAAPDPSSVLRVLVHGAQSVATAREPTGPAMPAFGRELTDRDIAAVATYIRNSWGHAAPPVTAAAVHEVRAARGSG
ncbi:MAG: cytochrome c [Gammaproteobacteria bacterium]|nr:cytochrome c [Gammaproteobacteria bacterium]